MSHVKNVEALARLVDFCTGYGGHYKPGHLNLHVSSMQVLLDKARTVLDEANQAQYEFDKTSNKRELAFLVARKLCTRIINAMVASGVHPLDVQVARANVRKIWGMRLKTQQPEASETDVATVKTRTARGLDFATMAENFSKLLEMASAEEAYQPNEPELRLESLSNTLAELRNLNKAVRQAAAQLSNARINRDTLLYESASNIYGTALAAKCYVKSAFGYESKQYKEVGKVRLTKPAA